jgi:hypothetical protein
MDAKVQSDGSGRNKDLGANDEPVPSNGNYVYAGEWLG